MRPVAKDVVVPMQRKQLIEDAVSRLCNKEYENPNQAARAIWRECWKIKYPDHCEAGYISKEQEDFIRNLRRSIVKLKSRL